MLRVRELGHPQCGARPPDSRLIRAAHAVYRRVLRTTHMESPARRAAALLAVLMLCLSLGEVSHLPQNSCHASCVCIACTVHRSTRVGS